MHDSLRHSLIVCGCPENSLFSKDVVELMYVGDGNKKSVGVVSSALIPVVRPSHCPQDKDKQRKPAHAKRLYTHATAWYTLL